MKAILINMMHKRDDETLFNGRWSVIVQQATTKTISITIYFPDTGRETLLNVRGILEDAVTLPKVFKKIYGSYTYLRPEVGIMSIFDDCHYVLSKDFTYSYKIDEYIKMFSKHLIPNFGCVQLDYNAVPCFNKQRG